MPRLRAWFSRLLGLFPKIAVTPRWQKKYRAHLDLLTERNIAAGMSPNDARNAALRQFGGVEQTKEIAREQRVWRWADEFVQDIRYGVRMLSGESGIFDSRNPLSDAWHRHQRRGFELDRRDFRFAPIRWSRTRTECSPSTARPGALRGFTGLSYPDFIDLERNSTLFESFIVDRIMGTTLSIGDRAERASGELFRRIISMRSVFDRFLAADFDPKKANGRNAHPVTVISYMTWQDRYKGDPDIIGKTQFIDRCSAHYHRRRAGKISRHFHRLLV